MFEHRRIRGFVLIYTPMHAVCHAAAKRVIALDFDGVVCDSVGESSLSAFKVSVAYQQANLK